MEKNEFRLRMGKCDTHHHNKVEHKEKGEAAGVAQKTWEGGNC